MRQAARAVVNDDRVRSQRRALRNSPSSDAGNRARVDIYAGLRPQGRAGNHRNYRSDRQHSETTQLPQRTLLSRLTTPVAGASTAPLGATYHPVRAGTTPSSLRQFSLTV